MQLPKNEYICPSMKDQKRYIIDPKTLEIKPHGVSGKGKTIRIAAMLVLAAIFAMGYIWIYKEVLGLEYPKTIYLKNRNAEWQTKMQVMDAQMDEYEQALGILEARENEVYRSMFGLNPIPDEVKHSGMSGSDRYRELGNISPDSPLRQTVDRIDLLTKQTYIHSKGIDEIVGVAKTAGDMVSCIPAVSPLYPDRNKVRLSSSFGYRSDPVYGGGEFHQGQDFATQRGVPVYATGDGVVEKAAFQFRGYGNEIVINHGFGYKTRYAHLNTIDVAPGMKVKRGDKIGEVGSTGKSTGPHLHYEVLYRDSRVNPLNYLDMSMPLDEYDAMVQRRKEESTISKKSSTTDILNKIKDHGKS